MIIICNENEYSFLANKCNGRCVAGEWCIFADETDRGLCPIDDDDKVLIVKDNGHKGLEVIE